MTPTKVTSIPTNIVHNTTQLPQHHRVSPALVVRDQSSLYKQAGLSSVFWSVKTPAVDNHYIHFYRTTLYVCIILGYLYLT